jgi:hypothetical protein
MTHKVALIDLDDGFSMLIGVGIVDALALPSDGDADLRLQRMSNE